MANPVIVRVVNFVFRQVADVSWISILVAALLHMLVSWGGFWLVDEIDVQKADIFWYFYATTATTVGYGDHSPATLGGRLITVFWIMPGGIILFTAIIGKLVQNISGHWRVRMKGLGEYSNLRGHVVIFGWRPQRTQRLIAMLDADMRFGQSAYLLVDSEIDENPLPERLKFVKSPSISSPDALKRSGVKTAEVAIILGRDDYETLTAAFSVSAEANNIRLVTYFENDTNADLLLKHCPNAECTVSVSTELMARSAYDPGSSDVQRQVLSTLEGPTQYSLVVPESAQRLTYDSVFGHFKEHHDATLIALKKINETIAINAGGQTEVQPGDRLFYIASSRMMASEISWQDLTRD